MTKYEKEEGSLSILGNIIWFLFGGAFMGISWCIAGILWSITIVGIPAGKQCFRLPPCVSFRLVGM